MKKLSILFVVCMLLVGVMCGCGNKNNKNNVSGTEISGAESSLLNQFVTAQQDRIPNMKATLGDSVDIAITAEGNSMVYRYTYTIEVDVEAKKAELQEQSIGFNQAFEDKIIEMRAAGIENASILVEFVAKDGAVVFSKEYK